MKRFIITFSLLSIWINQSLISQVSEPEIMSDVTWTVFWNGSLNLETSVVNRNRFTLNGFGAKMQKVYSSGLGIEAKFSFRSWSDLDNTVIPLTIGPSYTISSSKNMTFLVRSGVGPELIIGNDYSSVFAGFDIGPEVHVSIGQRHALVLGVAFAQAMSFHPNHFEYLDIYVGWRF